MILKKGEYIGTTDQLFREIHVGDTIQDSKGKLYTVNGYGYAKPLDGGNEVPIKSVKGCEVVDAWKPDDTPAPGMEVKGPVIKYTAPAPAKAKPIQEPPVPEPEFDPAPPMPAKPAGTFTGGRPNISGLVKLESISRTLDNFATCAELRAIAQENGIRLTSHNGKTCIPIGDKERLMELAKDLPAVADRPAKPPRKGNCGVHRTNRSGFVSFANLARGLKCKAYILRRLAATNGFEIIRAGTGKNRNDGIRLEDEARFRALAEASRPSGEEFAPVGALPVGHVLDAKGIDDDDIVQAVEERALWLRCLDECPGFSDTLLHNVLARRGFYGTPNPQDFLLFPPPLSKEEVEIIKSGKLAEHVKIIHHEPLEGVADASLADELRRRGFEVVAVKHIQL